MNLSLIRKGMILLAVPLLYQLALIGLFGWLQLRDATSESGHAQANPKSISPAVSTAVLVLGGVISFGLTAALALGFRRAISRRFDVLHENTRRLAEGRELTAPVQGSDEIAELDAAFRHMADALRSADEARRRSTAEVRDLYDNAPCGYHSLDADGRFVAVNETELRWLGYRRDEVVGVKRLSDVLTPDSQTRFNEQFPLLLLRRQIDNIEYDLVRRDGTLLPVLLNATVVYDDAGRFQSTRSTLFDLTERRRAEDAVRRLNADLERRVQERTAELAEANRDLLHKNQENETFVYSVSHDLRSPLVNLEGFSQELALAGRDLRAVLDGDTVPPAVRRRALEVIDGGMAESIRFIQTAVKRLSTIIDALLRLSRAGRIEYQWQSLDAAAIACRVADSMHATAAARKAVIAVGPLPQLRGDATAIEQIFANLIGNALNYLDPARPGRIEVGSLPAGADGLRTVFVRDNGVGIPEAYREKVFQAFQRLQPQAAVGEGMGLTIVRRIVERHRGRIWVESQVGAGSTFFVALPAAEPWNGALLEHQVASRESRGSQSLTPGY